MGLLRTGGACWRWWACAGARLGEALTHGQRSQEWANVGRVVELLVLVGGSFCPGAVVHSHVRCVKQELPGRALQPREQESDLGQVPGLFLPSKRGPCEHPVMEVLPLSV